MNISLSYIVPFLTYFPASPIEYFVNELLDTQMNRRSENAFSLPMQYTTQLFFSKITSGWLLIALYELLFIRMACKKYLKTEINGRQMLYKREIPGLQPAR